MTSPRHPLLLFLVALLLSTTPNWACTTAVISAKASANGRPLLWKVRDTDNLANSMRYFTDGRYPYIGLVDSQDTQGLNVWAGNNSVGFAIMNSASFNVNLDAPEGTPHDREGNIMKLALQSCRTLADFEQLLNSQPRPMGLAAHFGVIDAEGGAAFYEVNNETWTKYDANTAPNGYVIRTNYSETGKPDTGYGFIRRQTAQHHFTSHDKITARALLQDFSRSFYHPIYGKDFRPRYEQSGYDTDFIPTDDMITRHGTSSNIVVEGVLPHETPDLTTFWVQVGYPHTCLTLPLWVRAASLPSSLLYDPSLQNSPLNHYAAEWKSQAYPIGRSDGYHYLKMTEIVNPSGNGYLQRIERAERVVFDLTDQLRYEWHTSPPTPSDLREVYTSWDNAVTALYRPDANL